MRRFERPTQLPPDLRATRTYVFDGRLRHLRLRVRRRRQRVARSSTLDAALGVPAARRAGRRGRRGAPASSLCGAGAPPCTGGVVTVAVLGAATSAVAVVVRVVGGIAVAVVTTLSSLRLLGIRRGWVHGAARRRASAGASTIVVALGLNDWDWGADGLVAPPRSPSASRRRWPPPSRSTCWPVPARWRSASAPASSSRRARCAPCGSGIAVLRRYRELVRLARREGFGPFLSAAERAERTVDAPGVRLRRVLEEAGGVYIKLGQIAATRVDLLPARGLRRAGPAAEPGAARAARSGSRAVLEAELGATVERGVRRVRLGAARRGVDRPDLPGPAAHGRGRRRQGAAARHRGDDGARPRRARPARRPRPAAHAVRPGHALRRDARAVRRRACAPSSTSAARPTR